MHHSLLARVDSRRLAMSTTTTAPTEVTEGLYYGFTKDELDDEKTNYKLAVQKHGQMRLSAAGGTLQFVGLNGKQLTYNMADAAAYLENWRQELANAFDQLSGACMRYSDRAVARFQ